ncbi:AAA family ATPase [Pseudomonas sp. LjRoot277]|uniref:AAA family ATPase n=1 Tax=Pseudomonas sp. LjRoot277 TaxID=3342307 RepID=UPI003ED16C7F
MIDSLRLANIATYGKAPVDVDDLKEINFFYGANGAGKTSISRLIDSPSSWSDCEVRWRKSAPLEAMVYNNEFIEKNFTKATDLKGVFTLGEAQQAQLDQIADTKAEIGRLEALRDSLRETLSGADGTGGKTSELKNLESAFKDKCWDQKRKHDAIFQEAFTGFRNSADSFRTKVQSEQKSNSSALTTLESLAERAGLLYGDTPALASSIPGITLDSLTALHSDPILKKRVLGRSDVDIAAMIAKLNNSDWVRQGLKYFEQNNDACPFCQQATTKEFENSLAEYFDETFETDTLAIESLQSAYQIKVAAANEQTNLLLAVESSFLDADRLAPHIGQLNSLLAINQQRIHSKKAEPSAQVTLESLDDVAGEISAIINAANTKIVDQNKIVASFAAEKKKLTGEVWKYILDTELKDALGDFDAKRDALDKAIWGLNTRLQKVVTDISQKTRVLGELEKNITSIQPTVTAINHLLKSFGFRGFYLDIASTGSAYKLVRADGSDAKHTLSEGEKTFVTFLYFYHLLKGSSTTTGMTADRVVVIDDPVSSLDSDILFIVGSLIKRLFSEIRSKTGYIKQIFILTHNVYFHKEITFNQDRRELALKDESFWIVRKPGLQSTLERYPTNPIKTSYELLWAELRKPQIQSLTIQNTLRRILENYFKILGGVDLNNLYQHFEGEEVIHCRSLISWVNDGSHYTHDDLYVAIEQPMVASYTKIFFKIFKVTEQMPHYKMMMGDSFVDLDAPSAPAETQAPDAMQPQGETTIEALDNTQPIIVDQQALQGGVVSSSNVTLPPAPSPPDSHEDSDIPF